MSGFLAGLIVGCVVGVAVTLLALTIVAGLRTAELEKPRRGAQGKVFVGALALLIVCGVSYSMDLEKSALLALLLSVLLTARLGGARRGILVAGIAAVMVAYFLPPAGSLRVTGLDNQLALVLFVLGTFVAIILMEGNQWIKQWIATADIDGV
jgi:K+-sensing histidine kinase KdpD